jgi:potassium uptake TrkH family protein
VARRGGWLRSTIDDAARHSPARLALSVFGLVIMVFTGLLSVPAATTSGHRAPFVDALFTATSAVCVTGLVTVDTATFWSTFGQVVIITGVGVGGLGILTLASLLGLMVSRRLNLTQRIIAASETKATQLGEVGALLRAVIVTSLVIEVMVALVLFPRYLILDHNLGSAAWHAWFYALSSFNNAGFVIDENGLMTYAGDLWITLPIALAVFVGSLGFPVVLVLSSRWRRPATWPLHTKITLTTTLVLLALAVVSIGAFEWTNPHTLGPMSTGDRIGASIFSGVMPRSGGFNVVDVGEMRPSTWFLTDLFMFVGGGSASTAGGIKVATLAVLLLAALAEARGDHDIEAFSRRIPPGTVRLAVAVLLAGLTLVFTGTLALLMLTGYNLDRVLFEVISAFGTVGLSTGVTSHLPDGAKYVLSVLMFAGRTGSMTLAAALALRERRRMFRLPEERPIVG